MTAPIADTKPETMTEVPEGYRLVRDPNSTEMLANNIGAAVGSMSLAVMHRQDGGELREGATANLRIIRRWADMMLNGEVPQPGDGVTNG